MLIKRKLEVLCVFTPGASEGEARCYARFYEKRERERQDHGAQTQSRKNPRSLVLVRHKLNIGSLGLISSW